MWDDLLINGTSLSGLGVIEDFSGIARTPPLRGANIPIPGVAGEEWMPKVRDAYDFLVPLAFATDDHPTRMQKLATLEALVDSSSAVLTLTRRITVGTDELEQTCSGDYVSGLEPVFLGFDAARVPLVLRNLDGGWA